MKPIAATNKFANANGSGSASSFSLPFKARAASSFSLPFKARAASSFSLPFKGRAGVGMVFERSEHRNKPIPTQTLPLKGRAPERSRS